MSPPKGKEVALATPLKATSDAPLPRTDIEMAKITFDVRPRNLNFLISDCFVCLRPENFKPVSEFTSAPLLVIQEVIKFFIEKEGYRKFLLLA